MPLLESIELLISSREIHSAFIRVVLSRLIDMINTEQSAIQQQISIDQNDVENGVEEVRGQLFSVGPRYINLSYIGEGAYGKHFS